MKTINDMRVNKPGSFYWYLTIVVLTMLFFSPMTYRQIFEFDTSDYGAHLVIAQRILETGQLIADNLAIPHPLTHLLTILVKLVTGLSLNWSMWLIMLLAYALTGVILLRQIRQLWPIRDWKIEILQLGLVFGLLLATPIFALRPLDEKYYFGYISFSVYHNPTFIVLKPFALLIWLHYSQEAIKPKSSWKSVLFGIVFVSLAALAKPNMLIAFLPCVFILSAIQFLRQKSFNWRYTLYAIAIPSVIILAWQYWLAFHVRTGSQVIFSPFEIMGNLSGYLGIKLVLSLVFPLGLLLTQPGIILREKQTMSAWLLAFIGFCYAYLLAETGWSRYFGNFFWSAGITLFILFCESLFIYLKLYLSGQLIGWRKYVPGILLVIHVVCGLWYYYICLTHVSYV